MQMISFRPLKGVFLFLYTYYYKVNINTKIVSVPLRGSFYFYRINNNMQRNDGRKFPSP